jgi:hypothetical protein
LIERLDGRGEARRKISEQRENIHRHLRRDKRERQCGHRPR